LAEVRGARATDRDWPFPRDAAVGLAVPSGQRSAVCASASWAPAAMGNRGLRLRLGGLRVWLRWGCGRLDSNSGSHASQRGRYQFQSPGSFIAERSRIASTIDASSSTATARPTPIILKSIIARVAKIANTATITIAALVTTLAVALMPCATRADYLAAVGVCTGCAAGELQGNVSRRLPSCFRVCDNIRGPGSADPGNRWEPCQPVTITGVSAC
jgi:hypothetical protein